jgi:hypothetical protein
MTKAKSRHGKLKGAVLMMVLAVMTVLIIMLAGAMAIASTATNRANTNYEESQAYYTARSGVDVLTQTIMGDSKYKSDGSGGLTAIASGSSDKSQALELEEAIAGVLETNGAGKPVYNVSKSLKAWDSINDPQATQLKAAYPSSWQNIIDNSYMEFDVSDISWVDSTSGMMADPGDGKVKVKIQLLKLIYDDGSGAGINRNAISAAQSADLSGGSSSTYYIKDMWVLMECTATYNGISATVSKVITPIEKEKATNVGFTTLGSASLENNVDVIGGAVTGSNLTWQNDGNVTGSIFVNGNIDVNAQKSVDITNGESFIVNGNLIASNNLYVRANTTSSSQAPFMFVNGTIDASNNLKINPGNKTFNIITKNYKTGNNEPATINGNVYIDGYYYGDGNGLQNLSGAKPLVNGDLFISDRDTIDYTWTRTNVTDPSNPSGSLTGWSKSGTGTCVKTYLGGIVNYSANTATKKFDFSVNTTPFWDHNLKIGSYDALCTGKIYYYYDERVVSDVTQYSGCVELHALKQLLIAAGRSQTEVDAKFVEVNSDNLKYMLKMDRSDFVDGLTVTASDVTASAGSTPSFKMKLSIPKDATTRTTGDDRIELPTLFSKYTQYMCFDDSTCDFTDQGGTAISDFTYKEKATGNYITKPWKSILTTAYSDLNPANTPISYDEVFDSVWDLFCGLYKQNGIDMNVSFRTAAQQATVDGVGTFSGATLDTFSPAASVKSLSDLSTYSSNGDYLEVDTSSGNVILKLDQTWGQDDSYGSDNGGNSAERKKKGIIVTGGGYLYILVPNSIGFKNFKVITEKYYNDVIQPEGTPYNNIAVGGTASGATTVASPKIMWYVDDGAKITIWSGYVTLMGYLYGPGSELYEDGGLQGSRKMYYKGMWVQEYDGSSNKDVYPMFMGSAFMKKIGGRNNFGLVYIPPEVTRQPHEAKFSWQTGVVGYSYNGIKTAPAT